MVENENNCVSIVLVTYCKMTYKINAIEIVLDYNNGPFAFTIQHAIIFVTILITCGEG